MIDDWCLVFVLSATCLSDQRHCLCFVETIVRIPWDHELNLALIAIGNEKAKAKVNKWDDDSLRQHDKYQTLDEFRKTYNLSMEQLRIRYYNLRRNSEYAGLIETSKSLVPNC